jgi:hypothetical protein
VGGWVGVPFMYSMTATSSSCSPLIVAGTCIHARELRYSGHGQVTHHHRPQCYDTFRYTFSEPVLAQQDPLF